MLTRYEYLMSMILHKAMKYVQSGNWFFINETSWVTRFCVDMTTLKVYTPQKYYQVEPHNRIFIWPKDVRQAVGELNLIAAE